MKIHLHTIAAAGLLAACGDAVRTPEYAGTTSTPLIMVRARLPEGFPPDERNAWLWLQPLRLRPDQELGFPQRHHKTSTPAEPRAETLAPPESKELTPWETLPPGEHPFVAVARPVVGGQHLSALSLDDFVVYAHREHPTVFPFGFAGPSLAVRRGYQLIRRVCDPSGTVSFEHLPSDTVLALQPSLLGIAAVDGDPEHQIEAAAFAGCGLTLPAEDLGARHEVGPPRVKPQGAVFHPTEDRLFFLPVVEPKQPATQVDAFERAAGAVKTLVRGTFTPPLSISSDGRYLFAWNTDLDPRGDPTPRLARIDTTTGAMVRGPRKGVPSPNGRFAVWEELNPRPMQVWIFDFDSGTERMLGPGTPLAWAPDSTALLASQYFPADNRTQLALMRLDGGVEPLGAAAPWVPGPPRTWYFSDGAVHAVDASRSSGVAVTTIPLGSPAAATTATVIAFTDQPAGFSYIAFAPTVAQLFLWSERCLGFGPSMCTARLHRYSIATKTSTVVAQARTPMPVAVSPDGRRLALSSDGAIFMKDLSDAPL